MPNNKSKGSKAERELVKLFTENGWRAVRVAGSGVGEESPCDIMAGKLGRRGCVVEAKSSKSSSIYITREQIDDFVTFAHTIGLRPVIAARFNRFGWLFVSSETLKDSGKFWVLSLKTATTEGKKFGQFFED